jgi:PAP2 superfamily
LHFNLIQFFSKRTNFLKFLMNFFTKSSKILFLLLLALLSFESCRDIEVPTEKVTAHKFDGKVYWHWHEKFLEIDRYAKGYRPGPGPRALCYLNFSAYEAIVSGIPENNSMANLYADISIPKTDENLEYYWPACVNESFAFLMKRYFFHMEGEYADLFKSIEAKRNELHSEYANKTTPEILERSEKHGIAVAQAVYDWSKTDAIGHNAFLDPAPSSYSAPVGPGLWYGQSPGQRPMFPYWGETRLMAMRRDEIIAKPPIPYSEDVNSLFYTQAMEVYNTVNNIKNNGPGAYEALWLAEFWSDDMLGVTFAPPPRLFAILNQINAREDLNLAESAEIYNKLGFALNDAGVAIWKSKFTYNVERPFSYINRIVSRDYPEAATWQSILDNRITNVSGITPPFPAYPSGHSGFGGAGGKILSSYFEFTDKHPGTYTFTDNCHKDRTPFNGTPRTFASFNDMAKEDAYSRIPLGVHFRMDCDEGLRLGELAAQRVLELPWKR